MPLTFPGAHSDSGQPGGAGGGVLRGGGGSDATASRTGMQPPLVRRPRRRKPRLRRRGRSRGGQWDPPPRPRPAAPPPPHLQRVGVRTPGAGPAPRPSCAERRQRTQGLPRPASSARLCLLCPTAAAGLPLLGTRPSRATLLPSHRLAPHPARSCCTPLHEPLP